MKGCERLGKKLFIAEKPSVAQEFAKALDIKGKKNDGYLESDEYIVTWCVGHLVTMSYPESYDKRLKKWELDTLPFIPTTYKYEIIENVKLKVEDIYNTSRFWELDADKLDNLKSVDGQVMDQYINICTTNTKESSASYFIRKASGNKVSQFNITVSDWYSDRQDEMPDFLEPYKNSLVSDFFAEIYVFGTKFTAAQVLSSSTLKKY